MQYNILVYYIIQYHIVLCYIILYYGMRARGPVCVGGLFPGDSGLRAADLLVVQAPGHDLDRFLCKPSSVSLSCSCYLLLL